MPGRGTTKHVIRMGDGLWARLGVAAAQVGMDRTGVIRALVLWWLGYPGAEIPDRPDPDPGPAPPE